MLDIYTALLIFSFPAILLYAAYKYGCANIKVITKVALMCIIAAAFIYFLKLLKDG